MNIDKTVDQIRDQNLVVVAELTDLVAGVVQKIAGNEIANTLGGELINGQSLREMIAARVGQVVSKNTGGL